MSKKKNIFNNFFTEEKTETEKLLINEIVEAIQENAEISLHEKAIVEELEEEIVEELVVEPVVKEKQEKKLTERMKRRLGIT